jgi:uncharacterized membrane protein
MRISSRTVTRHWWQVAALALVLFLLAVSGVLACGIGIAVTVPVSMAAFMYAYEDIFN